MNWRAPPSASPAVQAGGHRTDLVQDLLHFWFLPGIVGEQVEKRGLLDTQAPDQVGTARREPEDDGAPEREANDVCGREIQVFDQGRQIGSVLFDAPLSGRTFALAVAAAVVDEDAEALGEGRHSISQSL